MPERQQDALRRASTTESSPQCRQRSRRRNDHHLLERRGLDDLHRAFKIVWSTVRAPAVVEPQVQVVQRMDAAQRVEASLQAKLAYVGADVTVDAQAIAAIIRSRRPVS